MQCKWEIKFANNSPISPRASRILILVGLYQADLQQVLVEPRDGLEEGLLLGELLMPLGHVAADGESVLGTGVKGDLVGQAGLLEDLLGLVALVGGEDLVGFGGGDGQGAGDGGELVLINKGRMGHVADVDSVLVVAGDVLERNPAG